MFTAIPENPEQELDWRTVPRTVSISEAATFRYLKGGKEYIWSVQLIQSLLGARVVGVTVESQHGQLGKPYSIKNHRQLWRGISEHWGRSRYLRVLESKCVKLVHSDIHRLSEPVLPTIYGGTWEHYVPKKKGLSKEVQKNVSSLLGFLEGDEPSEKRARAKDNGLDAVVDALSEMYTR